MARYYVKNNEGNWNIWSTIVDNYLLDSFIPFEDLKILVLEETIQKKIEDLNTLLTDRPRLNVKSYEDCEDILRESNIDLEDNQEYEEPRRK